MGKNKPQVDAKKPKASDPIKSGVKSGHIVKPAQTQKAKSKVMAQAAAQTLSTKVPKAAAAQAKVKSKGKKSPSPSDSSESDEDSDESDADSEEDSEDSDVSVTKLIKAKSNGQGKVNVKGKGNVKEPAKKVITDANADSESSDSGDDKKIVNKKTLPAKAGSKLVKEAGNSNAKSNSKKPAQSSADTNSDADSSSDSESESDDAQTLNKKAAPVANGPSQEKNIAGDESSSEEEYDTASIVAAVKPPAMKQAIKNGKQSDKAKAGSDDSGSDSDGSESDGSSGSSDSESNSDGEDESSPAAARVADPKVKASTEPKETSIDASRKRKMTEVDDDDAKRAKVEEASSGLFIGNLSWNVDNDMLSEAFQTADGFKEARVIFDKEKGRSRGFGYVDFDHPEGAAAAFESMQGHELDGRAIKLEFSGVKKTTKTNEFRARASDRAQEMGDATSPESDTLFVGNLPFSIEQQQVHELFSEIAEVVSVRLPTDPTTQSLKGFGYVTFSSIEDAKKAFEALNGTPIGEGHNSRCIRLDYSSRTQNRDGFNSGGRDNGGSGRGRGRGRDFGNDFGRNNGRNGDRGGYDSGRGRGRGRGSFDSSPRGSRGGFGGRGRGDRFGTRGGAASPPGQKKIVFDE